MWQYGHVFGTFSHIDIICLLLLHVTFICLSEEGPISYQHPVLVIQIVNLIEVPYCFALEVAT
jgi:hypothetical protein